MPSVFAYNDGPCGIFSQAWECAPLPQQTLSFARAAHLLGDQPPLQNARGDLIISFVGIGTYTGSLQPIDRGLLRELHGIVVEGEFLFMHQGMSTLRELDRTVVEGVQVEVAQVGRYYGSHEEIVLSVIGR